MLSFYIYIHVRWTFWSLLLVNVFIHTRRGRSRAQHVRDCEADIERAKKWGPGHLRRWKGEDVGPSRQAHCRGV